MKPTIAEKIKWYKRMSKEEKWLYKYSNLWMTPLLFALMSLLLFLATVWADLWMDFGQLMPLIQPDYELTMNILSALTTGLLSLTSFTFYGVLTALTTFSNMFSPRILRNFMITKKTQRTLGIFIGSFLYVILCLLFLTEESEYFFIPTTATLLSVISLGAFVVFINHIINWLQVTNMTLDMKNESLNIIGRSPINELELTQLENRSSVKNQIPQTEGHHIFMKESGYLQTIYFKELMEEAIKDNIVIRLEHKVDNFVFGSTPIATYWKMDNSGEEIDEEKFSKMFHLGRKQRELHDIEYSLNKFVEIAIRALGNNDPITASGTIHQIGDLLINISQKESFTSFLADEDQKLRIILKSLDFDEYLYISFASIRHYTGQNTVVTMEMLKVLHSVSQGVKERDHESVWNFVDYMIKGFEANYLHRLDRRRFYVLIWEIACLTGHASSFEKLANKTLSKIEDEEEQEEARKYIKVISSSLPANVIKKRT
ncbi:DUF2254 domain-containing protein [Jeotgalibacillus proteolyticus]|uniref:DUF2254 domain-containing protein n=1 Tax=Jeotgalibacillus proteolyticus TaxID=2082395 RepID=A0A2S5GFN3_9BACL|nr:DUF2254 domain-containing protein [Jeotgalibacillus proteolyticus]PPA71714.1 DUF2254 domain-containing protein [Jeotgalibacillus proteolyticus]